jgi:hypothetical protein
MTAFHKLHLLRSVFREQNLTNQQLRPAPDSTGSFLYFIRKQVFQSVLGGHEEDVKPLDSFVFASSIKDHVKSVM